MLDEHSALGLEGFLDMPLAGWSAERRFHREGRILGRLVHPYIAELVDAGVSAAGQTLPCSRIH